MIWPKEIRMNEYRTRIVTLTLQQLSYKYFITMNNYVSFPFQKDEFSSSFDSLPLWIYHLLETQQKSIYLLEKLSKKF